MSRLTPRNFVEISGTKSSQFIELQRVNRSKILYDKWKGQIKDYPSLRLPSRAQAGSLAYRYNQEQLLYRSYKEIGEEGKEAKKC